LGGGERGNGSTGRQGGATAGREGSEGSMKQAIIKKKEKDVDCPALGKTVQTGGRAGETKGQK